MPVFLCLAAAHPGARVEQQLKGPFVAGPLAEAAMAVGMGVDKAGHEQPIGGVDDPCVVGGLHSRWPYFDDAVARDQEVRRLDHPALGIEQPAVPNDLMIGCCGQNVAHTLQSLGDDFI